MYSEVVFVFN